SRVRLPGRRRTSARPLRSASRRRRRSRSPCGTGRGRAVAPPRTDSIANSDAGRRIVGFDRVGTELEETLDHRRVVHLPRADADTTVMCLLDEGTTCSFECGRLRKEKRVAAGDGLECTCEVVRALKKQAGGDLRIAV